MAETLLFAVVLAGSGLTALHAWRLRAHLAAAEHCLWRLRVQHAERQRVLEDRLRLASVQQTSEAVVHIGTQTVRGVHQAIASIPFAILEQVPVTRDASRVVRVVHDVTAEGVYAAISAVNRIIGKGLREVIRAEDSEKKSE